MTGDTYWREGEGAQLCSGDALTRALQGVHGPPEIIPMPDDPCTETAACDPDRYNAFLVIWNVGNGFTCSRANEDTMNTYNTYKCDAANSGLFINRFDNPVKALLCYNDPDLPPG